LPALFVFYLFSMLGRPDGIVMSAILGALMLFSTFLSGLGGLLANLAVVLGFVAPSASWPNTDESDPAVR
jgi:hypothetical protein